MAQLFGLARLGRDAELRATPKGEHVARLSLAFTWGTKGDDGKRAVLWVDGNFWGKRAEALSQYLTKGSLVSVTLEDVHMETFQSQGVDRTKMVGRVGSLDLAGGTQQAAAPAQAPKPPAPAPRPGSGFDDMDDDIPF